MVIRLITFPSEGELQREAEGTPEFMRPSRVPYAVVLEGFLSDESCDRVVKNLTNIEPYLARGCGATTRECVSDPSLDVIETVARQANEDYFRFDLDPGQHSWLQLYTKGGSYQRHQDGSPGQMRKLTAVVLLSDPAKYRGGWLTLCVAPKEFMVPNTRGTIVIFPSWIEHYVTEVVGSLSAERHSLNMGFWGPDFR